jgi:hypothetical protein
MQLLSGSLSSSSWISYDRAARMFLEFCQLRRLRPVPALPSTIAAFLVQLRRRGNVRGGAVRPIMAAIAKLHLWAGAEPPQRNPIIAMAVRGFQRLTQGQVNRLRRVPLLSQHALTIARLGMRALSSGDVRTATSAACVLFQFVFFARASTAAAQRACDVFISGDVISVRLSSEKQRTPGERVLHFVRLNTGPAAQPWDFLAAYIRQQRAAEAQFLFGRLNQPVPYRAVSAFWGAATRVRPPVGGTYTPHSGRIGGASAALAFGIPEVVVQRRGGWRSATSMMPYVFAVPSVPADRLFFYHLRPSEPPSVPGFNPFNQAM